MEIPELYPCKNESNNETTLCQALGYVCLFILSPKNAAGIYAHGTKGTINTSVLQMTLLSKEQGHQMPSWGHTVWSQDQSQYGHRAWYIPDQDTIPC